MQINSYNSQVSNRYLEKSKSKSETSTTKSSVGTKVNSNNTIKLNTANSSPLINSQERDFFKTLFPENSDQIDKHIVFNRNGKINSFSLAKGLIVDGKA